MALLPLYEFENESGEMVLGVTPEGKLKILIGRSETKIFESIELDESEVTEVLVRFGKFITKEVIQS